MRVRTSAIRAVGPAALLALAVGAVGVGNAHAAQPSIDTPIAILQALDKVTARVSTLDMAVGDTVTFGTLQVTVRACRTTAPDEAPENAAFVEVYDEPPDSERVRAFSGWMFSSSPSLSAMDHPVYDVWVIRCLLERPPQREDFGVPQRRFSLPNRPPVPPALPTARGG